MTKKSLISEILKVMEDIEKSSLVFLFFMIFFVNGYILHGTFIGFKPLDLSQILISVTIGFFVSVPLIAPIFFIMGTIIIVEKIKEKIEKEDTSGAGPSKEKVRVMNLAYLIATGMPIYIYNSIVLFCWFVFTNMKPIVENSLILAILLCLYALPVVILVSTAVKVSNKKYKKWKKKYDEMVSKKRKSQN